MRLTPLSDDYLSALAEPSFVGGEVIVSSVFSTLIAQVYFKPLLSSFVDWVTNTGQNAGKPFPSRRVCHSSHASTATDDEPTDELIGVLACNCGVVGMDLPSAKVFLLRQHGSMLIALRRAIPNAPKSMYTVVNPVASHTLEARYTHARQCSASSSSSILRLHVSRDQPRVSPPLAATCCCLLPTGRCPLRGSCLAGIRLKCGRRASCCLNLGGCGLWRKGRNRIKPPRRRMQATRMMIRLFCLLIWWKLPCL